MSYRITREHVWVGVIDDRPGALAERLRNLAEAGINLELILTRRERQGKALMFVSPLRTPEEVQQADRCGLAIAETMRNLRIDGPNEIGLAARITQQLADAGINISGYSAAALGDQHVTNIALDREDDEQRAREILGELLNG